MISGGGHQRCMGASVKVMSSHAYLYVVYTIECKLQDPMGAIIDFNLKTANINSFRVLMLWH